MGYTFSIADTVEYAPDSGSIEVHPAGTSSEEPIVFSKKEDIEEFVINPSYITQDDTLAYRETIIDTINADPLLHDTIQTKLNEEFILPNQIDFITDPNERKKLYEHFDMADSFLYEDPAYHTIIVDSINSQQEELAHLELWQKDEYKRISDEDYADPDLKLKHLNDIKVHGRVLKRTDTPLDKPGHYREKHLAGVVPGGPSASYNLTHELLGIPLPDYLPGSFKIPGKDDLTSWLPNIIPDEGEEAEGITSLDKLSENPGGYIEDLLKVGAISTLTYNLFKDRIGIYYDPAKKGAFKFTRNIGGLPKPNLAKDLFKGLLKFKTGYWVFDAAKGTKRWVSNKLDRFRGPKDPPTPGTSSGSPITPVTTTVDKTAVDNKSTKKADKTKEKKSKMVINNLLQNIDENKTSQVSAGTPNTNTLVKNLIMTSMYAHNPLNITPSLKSLPSTSVSPSLKNIVTPKKVFSFPNLFPKSIPSIGSSGGGGSGRGGGDQTARGFRPGLAAAFGQY